MDSLHAALLTFLYQQVFITNTLTRLLDFAGTENVDAWCRYVLTLSSELVEFWQKSCIWDVKNLNVGFLKGGHLKV
jgi:hypothetical protein